MTNVMYVMYDHQTHTEDHIYLKFTPIINSLKIFSFTNDICAKVTTWVNVDHLALPVTKIDYCWGI